MDSQHKKFSGDTDPAGKKIQTLLEDAVTLAKYASDLGIMPDSKDLERLTWLQHKAYNETLSEDEIYEIVQHYDKLSRSSGNVTAHTIRASTALQESYWRSIAGRHLIKLWTITLFVGLLIFLYFILEYRISYYDTSDESVIDLSFLYWVRLQQYSTFLVPFTYGALGACAYLLRSVEQKLQKKEFDPSRIPQHWNRLVLGTLSGGMIVMLISTMPGGGTEETSIQLSEGVLGFLAGYSIDFLFQILDRTLQAVAPKVSDIAAPKEDKQRLIKLMQRYQYRLNDTNDPTEKKILSEVVEDLKT